MPSKDAAVDDAGGELVITSSGGDPYVTTTDIPAARGPYVLTLRMRSSSRGPGQVFWATATAPAMHRSRSTAFAPTHDGASHEYVVKLPVEEALTALRLDPGTAPGVVRVSAMRLAVGSGALVKEWRFGGK
jgi:hypothetical protein